MPYTVTTAFGAFNSLRVMVETPEEAVRIAQEYMEDGKAVRILDQAGRASEVVAFQREVFGHTLSDQQLAFVKSTSDVLAASGVAASDLFYAKLFEIAPEVRSMFADDMAAQKVKLKDTLVALVEQIDAPEDLRDMLQRLGQRHRGYGAKTEHYGPVGAALLCTLETALGPRFTPEVKAAWAALYLDVAATMIGVDNVTAAASSA